MTFSQASFIICLLSKKNDEKMTKKAGDGCGGGGVEKKTPTSSAVLPLEHLKKKKNYCTPRHTLPGTASRFKIFPETKKRLGKRTPWAWGIHDPHLVQVKEQGKHVKGRGRRRARDVVITVRKKRLEGGGRSYSRKEIKIPPPKNYIYILLIKEKRTTSGHPVG